MVPCHEHVDGIVQAQHILGLRLTPALWGIILLHHQWDHVQLLLMGVVLRRDQPIETDTMPMHTHFNSRAVLRGGGGQTHTASILQLADSLYARLTPYSITSALTTQSTEAVLHSEACTRYFLA